MRKKIFTIALTLILALSTATSTASAAQPDTLYTTVSDADENGNYFETTIEIVPTVSMLSTTQTKTAKKTTSYKNSSGTVLWSITIKATFSYDGKTSKCTSCSHSTNVSASGWTISNASSSKSGNSATATATAKYQRSNEATQKHTKSVTIRCSANGTIS